MSRDRAQNGSAQAGNHTMVLVSHRRGSKAEVGQMETGATGNGENLESPQQRAQVQLSSNTRKHTPSGTQIP